MDLLRHIGLLGTVGLVGVVHGTLCLAGTQVRISGLTEINVVEVREEGEQLLIESDDGRLFSVARDHVSVEEIHRGLETSSNEVTVAEILALLASGISERTITVYVQNRGAHFDLSAADLIELERAGAADSLLQFLIRASGKQRLLPGYNGPRREAGQETSPSTTQPLSDSYSTDKVPEGVPYYPFGYPGYTPYAVYAPHFVSPAFHFSKPRPSRVKDKNRVHHRGQRGSFHAAPHRSSPTRQAPEFVAEPPRAPRRTFQPWTPGVSRPSPSRRGGFSRSMSEVGATGRQR